MNGKKITSTTVYNGVIVDVTKDTFLFEDNSKFTAEVVNHPGGVCIAGIDDDKNVFVVNQFRFGAHKPLTELPAGLLDPNEIPKDAALRELREETGYSAKHIVSLGTLYLSPGGSNEVIHLFLAHDLTFVGQDLDETESLTVSKMPFANLYNACVDGSIEDAKTVALTIRAESFLKAK